MKVRIFVLLITTVLTFNTLYSQSTQKILFYLENDSQLSFITVDGLQRVYLIYENMFLDSDGMTFNKSVMEKYLDAIIPDKNEIGFAVLDWESYPYYVLRGGVKRDVRYQQFLNEFISAIRYAKLLRPNIKWSFYDMPSQTYKSYTLGKEDLSNTYVPLLKELDFMAPSLYAFYDGKPIEQGFALQYIDDQLKFALEFGKKFKKPVYPFFWERYAPFTDLTIGYQYPYMLIPISTFTQMVKRILNTKNLDRKVDGIIWWHFTYNLYKNHRVGNPILTEEFKNVKDINAYMNAQFHTYLDSIKPLFTH